MNRDTGARVNGAAAGNTLARARRRGRSDIVLALLCVLVPSMGHAQGLAVRYTMDAGSVPPSASDRDAGTVVSKALDGQPLCGAGPAYMANWDGIVAWNDRKSFTGAAIPVQTSGRYFLRLPFRLDADVDRVDGGKMLRVGYPGGLFAELFGNTSTFKMQAGDSVYWGGAPVTRGCHRLEVAVTPTGMRAWLDDVLLREWSGVTSSNVINLMSNWSSNPGWEHDANNHVYFDDIEVYTDTAGADAAAMWAGTIGGGSAPPPPVDPPPPPPPGEVCGDGHDNDGDGLVDEGCTAPPPPPPVDTCVSAPIVVTGIAWPGITEGTRSGRFSWSVAGLVVQLQSAVFEFAPQRLVITDDRGCTVTVQR